MTEATRKRGDYRRHMTGEHAANAAVFSAQMEAAPMRAFPSNIFAMGGCAGRSVTDERFPSVRFVRSTMPLWALSDYLQIRY